MRKLAIAKILTGLTLLPLAAATRVEAAFVQTNLVSNNPLYTPQLIDPLLLRSRSIAIRPASAGFGGHFWINNLANGTNTVYVGDVSGIPIFQDSLTFITLPASGQNPTSLSSPTGQVFNGSRDFVITQNHPNGSITAPAKFLFASLDGTISAWTDRKRADGTSDWPTEAVIVVDRYASSSYQGVTVSDLLTDNRIYAADFGLDQAIEVFDPFFNEITASFAFINPFAAQGYAPYNIQTFNGSLYVTYAQPSTQDLGEALAGSGQGKLAQFDFQGNLLAVWEDGGRLNVPAGMAIAPADFGEFSQTLLVANFGDGTIVAFDQTTRQSLGYLRDARGIPLNISGIWGLTFGNGKSLGEANDLYFSADPQPTANDGLFGKVEFVLIPESDSVPALVLFLGIVWLVHKRSNEGLGS